MLEEKTYKYKVIGKPKYYNLILMVQRALWACDNVKPESVKIDGFTNDEITFKFKGTQIQLETLLNILSEIEYNIIKVRKCLF